MTYQYLILDSRSEPVAHGVSRDGPDRPVWQVEIDGGDVKKVLSHEYVYLLNTSEGIPAMEGRVMDRRGDTVSIQSVRELGEEVRKNLRMPVRFESFLYPVTGTWKGRVPVLSNDLSCGGVAFFCARPLEVGEVAQIAIPVTSRPLLADVRILRERPSPEPIPLYAAEFVELIHDQETMIREAVFSIQLQKAAEDQNREEA